MGKNNPNERRLEKTKFITPFSKFQYPLIIMSGERFVKGKQNKKGRLKPSFFVFIVVQKHRYRVDNIYPFV